MTAEQKALLSRVKTDIDRVQVVTALNELKWRPVGSLHDTDKIQLKTDGLPKVMKGKLGRKAVVEIKPANDTVEALLKKRDATLAADGVLQATSRKVMSEDEVMTQIIKALGEEQASMVFVRQEMERTGQLVETTTVSSKRISGLRALAETVGKRMESLREKSLDLDGPAFRAVYKHILETFKEALSLTGSRPEMVETVFARYAALTADPSWEIEAKIKIKNAF